MNKPKSGARFFMKESIEDLSTQVVLDKEISHHVVRVLRCSIGDSIDLIATDGATYRAELTSDKLPECHAQILEKITVDTESPFHISLLQALVSNEKLDLIVQKVTELGVQEVAVFRAERSQVRLNSDRLSAKLQRWEKISQSACEQSGRVILPKITVYDDLTDLLKSRETHNANKLRMVLTPTGKHTIKAQTGELSGAEILVGPEGGFTNDEIILAKNAGFLDTALGPRTLRAETAGIISASIVQALWGDL